MRSSPDVVSYVDIGPGGTVEGGADGSVFGTGGEASRGNEEVVYGGGGGRLLGSWKGMYMYIIMGVKD